MKDFDSTYIKSAFVGQTQKGAPASVNLVEDIKTSESIDKMQKYTQELNLPISCFIKKAEADNKFYIRYFIKDNEEPICGHGTLVTTQFIIDNKLIDDNINQITFIPLLTPEKPIISYIEQKLISLHIKTAKPIDININSEIGQKIIKSISNSSNQKIEKYNYKNIVEGEYDYTVEIDKFENNENNLTSLEIIKSIKPDFDLIEQIQLRTGKLCRGIDVLIKNYEKDDSDYISRIFLPLGADEKYKEVYRTIFN